MPITAITWKTAETMTAATSGTTERAEMQAAAECNQQ
jgi:hypothetical protein